MCVPQTTTLGKGIYNKRRGQIHERDSIQQLIKKDTKFPNDDVCVEDEIVFKAQNELF